jgi:hypothetical protein
VANDPAFPRLGHEKTGPVAGKGGLKKSARLLESEPGVVENNR